VAEEVLAMSISLTPEQIRELARQINEAISGLTNIDAILEATRADLARARDLEQRANRAKSVSTLSVLCSSASYPRRGVMKIFVYRDGTNNV